MGGGGLMMIFFQGIVHLFLGGGVGMGALI